MRTVFFLLTSLILLLNAFPTNAALIDRGGGLIYDDLLDITWLQDANYAQTSGYDLDGEMDWYDSMYWVDTLEYYDPVRNITWSDWRLPKTLPKNPPDYDYTFSYDGTTDHGYNITRSTSELCHIYYVTLGNKGYYDTSGNIQGGSAWRNKGLFQNIDLYYSAWASNELNSLNAFSLNGVGKQDANSKDNIWAKAWAVRDGDVGPIPSSADFIADPVSGPAPLTVNFTDESTGIIDTWEWDFGDGENSTAQNPIYTYSNPGTYTVSLTVTGPGGSDTETKTDYITVSYPAPVADFSANPITGKSPHTVNFTDQSTGDITSWSWDFGDNSTSTNQNPTHTYDDPGTYTVKLTVAGPGGTDTETKSDYIVVEDVTLIANFIADTTSGVAPLTVNFTDESVGDITSCLWNFGDGETSIEENPTHTYTDEGIYNVSLSVSGPHGNDTEVKLGYVTVSEPDDDNGDDGGGGGGCFISTPFLGICPISQHRED